jgi:hypothetical protein
MTTATRILQEKQVQSFMFPKWLYEYYDIILQIFNSFVRIIYYNIINTVHSNQRTSVMIMSGRSSVTMTVFSVS